MPFLTAQRSGKVDQYQTYLFPMAGTKRKLMVPADDSGPTGSPTPAQAPSKKMCLNNSDSYNPKYMAHMCFEAHVQRIRVAGLVNYPCHVEEDYRQDLASMFTHAHSKGSFRLGIAARHMIPRLAGIASQSKQDKTAIVQEFIKHYDTVRDDLLLILDILASCPEADLDSASLIRNRVINLHVTLLGNARWRTIMPYTPLPKACLPKLRNFVADPKQSHILEDLTDHISDMESWLNPPSPFVEFPTRLTASVMDKLQHQTERSPGKAGASPLVQTDASIELIADTEEQRIKQVHLLEERIDHMDLLSEQRAHQFNLLKEQFEQAMAEQARLANRVETLELAAADQIAQYKLKEEAWATLAAELEKEHRNQIIQQNSKIDRLSEAFSIEQDRNAVIEAQQNNRIDRLDAVLSAEQKKSAAVEVNAARLADQATDRTNASIGVPDSSNLTTNNSLPEISSFSHTISSKLTDSHSNGQPHPFQLVRTHAVYQNLPVAIEFVDGMEIDDDMEMDTVDDYQLDTVNNSEMDIESPTKTNSSRVSCSNLLPVGLVNPFEQNTANSLAPQPHVGKHKVSREACRDLKLGKCRRGKKCRFSHKACRRWLSGTCNNGENCHRSHDSFFLEKSNLQPWPDQSLSVNKVATPEALPPSSFSMIQERQVHNTQLDLGQMLNPCDQQKKQACKSFLSNSCHEDQDCKYAHKPCFYFMSGVCKFTNQTCRNSHDPLFFMLGGAERYKSQSASSQHKKRSGLRSNRHELDQMIRFAAKCRKKSGRVSV